MVELGGTVPGRIEIAEAEALVEPASAVVALVRIKADACGASITGANQCCLDQPLPYPPPANLLEHKHVLNKGVPVGSPNREKVAQLEIAQGRTAVGPRDQDLISLGGEQTLQPAPQLGRRRRPDAVVLHKAGIQRDEIMYVAERCYLDRDWKRFRLPRPR